MSRRDLWVRVGLVGEKSGRRGRLGAGVRADRERVVVEVGGREERGQGCRMKRDGSECSGWVAVYDLLVLFFLSKSYYTPSVL